MIRQVLYRIRFVKCNFAVNEPGFKQYGITTHFSTRQNLLKKIFRKDRLTKVYIDTINREKVIDRFADHK